MDSTKNEDFIFLLGSVRFSNLIYIPLYVLQLRRLRPKVISNMAIVTWAMNKVDRVGISI